MIDAAELNRVLKYRWDRKDEALPHVADPDDIAAHMAFGDLLQEADDHRDRDLGKKVAEEVQRTLDGQVMPLKLKPRPGEADPHNLLRRLRQYHPNPTVRAMARQIPEGFTYSKELVDHLLRSPDNTRYHDHDAAVYLSPDDDNHTIADHLNMINRGTRDRRDRTTNEFVPGHHLTAKVVRGKVFLLDAAHPDRPYGAPAIVFEGSATHSPEVRKLREMADAIAAQRTATGGVGIHSTMVGPATIGPVVHGS